MPVCMSQMLAVVACRGTATVVVAGGKETKDLRFCKEHAQAIVAAREHLIYLTVEVKQICV
jgi:DhnA family fructose-bisphosphate aldolase class Ia